MTGFLDTITPTFLSLGHVTIALSSSTNHPDIGSLEKLVGQDLVVSSCGISRPERRREWLVSRALMRDLTGEVPTSGPHGELLWRGAMSGSLSHKDSHIAFGFGPKTRLYGIDLESCRPLTKNVIDKIMTTREQARLNDETNEISSAVFSAKESIYKFLFTDVGQRFYFDAVELKDCLLSHNVGILVFSCQKDLSARVLSGKTLIVDVQRVQFNGCDFWLTSVRGST